MFRNLAAYALVIFLLLQLQGFLSFISKMRLYNREFRRFSWPYMVKHQKDSLKNNNTANMACLTDCWATFPKITELKEPRG